MTVEVLHDPNAERRKVAALHIKGMRSSGVSDAHLLYERLDLRAKRDMLPDARVFVLERVTGEPEAEVDVENFKDGVANVGFKDLTPHSALNPKLLSAAVGEAMGAADLRLGFVDPQAVEVAQTSYPQVLYGNPRLVEQLPLAA